MSSVEARHPTEEQLLRYADGELPAREASAARTHLEACWQCRADLAGMQKLIGDCVSYRKTVLKTCLPAPPAPWCDLYSKFAEVNRRERPFARRLTSALRFVLERPAAWAPAVATLVAVALFVKLGQTPSAQAAELLRKAVAVEPRAPKERRIQIRTPRHRVTRTIAVAQPARAEPPAAGLASLQAMFVAAHYSWEDPLSARSFQAWRDQLADKHDEVTAVRDREAPERSCYRIRTTTQSGELREATLNLRMRDLHPFESTLRFRNQEWAEISELPEDAGASTEAMASVPGHRAEPPLPGAVRAPRDTPQPVTPGEELQVLATLHQLGADLGDPIEVTRSHDRILVSGVGVAPERRQEIQAALQPLQGVVVRFSDPAEPPSSPAASTVAPPAAASDASQFQARLEEQAGGRVAFEELSARVLDDFDKAMARVYALRRLTRNFPEGVEAQLTPPERQLLRQLRKDHASDVTSRVSAVQRIMAPMLMALGGVEPPAARLTTLSGPWQPAVEELFRAARSVETTLATILGGAASPARAGDLPTELLRDLAQLRAYSETNERLSDEEVDRNAR